MTTDPDANLPTRVPAERVTVSQAGGNAAPLELAGTKVMGVLRTGAGALTRTITRMLLLGVVLAIVAGRIAGEKSGTAGFLAVLLTLGITIVAGFMLAWQRAGLLALAEAIEASGLASRLLKSAFRRVIGEEDGGQKGFIARTAGRIPLSQAEQRMRAALEEAAPELESNGLMAGVFRRAHSVVLGTIRRVTFAEFRREEAAGGGIDLAKVRDHLASHIDKSAAAGVRSRVRWITMGFVLLTIGATLGIAWLLRQLFTSAA